MLILFFATYAPGATDEAHRTAILSANLVCRVVANAIQIAIGLVCMRSQLARNLAGAQEVKATTAKEPA